MPLEVKVPQMGESITNATVAKVYVKPGDFVNLDAALFELETEKINISIAAPKSGLIKEVFCGSGDEVEVGTLVCTIDEKAASDDIIELKNLVNTDQNHTEKIEQIRVSPAAQNIINNSSVSGSSICGSAHNGVITKQDVVHALQKKEVGIVDNKKECRDLSVKDLNVVDSERTCAVKMSPLRKTVAKRLKEVQNTAAILTTFNEVDMSAVMEMRKKYQDDFVKKFNTKLGFMSIFTRAVVLALKEIPAVNAEINGDSIIYKNYYNIGVAIGSEKGLFVPVIRDADRMGLHEIELEIARYSKKVSSGTLSVSDFEDGTFTISNGGVYGSMMSTPIINPPQSGILGMHSIVERAIAINGAIVVRPMMYLALSYDHRIVDGREAITFLVKIKNYIENPQRMLLFV